VKPLRFAWFLSALVFGALGCAPLSEPETTQSPTADQPEVSPHLRMGNPSRARADREQPDNYLLDEPYFALSYNSTKGTPNWVSWRLVRSDIGRAPRGQFHPDPLLPRFLKRVVPNDYNGSGFDRGHMCPHSDRSADREMSEATFVMTNMVPQSPRNNQHGWNTLEIYTRDLVVKEHKVCYIVAGPYGEAGVGRNGRRDTTPNGRVVVPAKTWKVILVLGHDVDDPADLDDGHGKHRIRLIGVVMPNDQTVGDSWAKYRVPVKEIEDMTGYTFFDRVPADVIDPLKEKRDAVHIAPAEAPHHKKNR
jgi:endonuclease G